MNRQIVSYVLFGGSAFVVEYLLFLFIISLYNQSGALIVAQSISFCAGLVVSFLGNRLVTFKSKNEVYTRKARSQAIMYLTLAAFNLVLSNAVIYILVHQLDTPEFVAKLAVMGMIIIWNFLIFKKVIFK